METQKKYNWAIALLACGGACIIAHALLFLLARGYSKWPLIIFILLTAPPLTLDIVKKLWRKNFGADVLAAISIIAAVILGEYLASTLVILMLLSGQTLERFALARASSILHELAKRMPLMTRRRKDGREENITLDQIAVNDLIVLLPHETSPVDGVVEEGHGFMDESYLTGEPYRVAKAKGGNVISGAINGESLLLVRCLKLPKDSRYAQIIKVLEVAEQKKPQLRRLGDQLGAIFAPISLIAAIVAWIVSSDPLRFLSVLVIATPCPLLIAIPIAIISAISLGARRGIIITDPVALERLPTCTTAIFDKTGTLTFGRPTLTAIHVATGLDEDQVLTKVASLEQYSKHPLAEPILKAAQARHLVLANANNVSETPGQGLRGNVLGKNIVIGSRQRLESKLLSSDLPAMDVGLECVVLLDDRYAATLQFHDEPKPDSKSFLHHLVPFHAFKKIMIVSGDRESEVRYLSERLGVSQTFASQSPEEKFAIVLDETRKAPTLFVGDGINDAPALRVATVGIAIGQGIAERAASVVVMDNTFSKIDEVFHLANDMRRIALESAVLGMALSFLGMGFAAFGFISPVVGAILQQIIDALAIVNALRLTWHRDVKIDLPKNDTA